MADLLSSDVADLSNALCTRRLVTRDDEITVPLNSVQAMDSRDALSKSLYAKLFKWLVDCCNAKLVDDEASCAFVGILDIFGFEQFKVNSFEQLCINYANERLQQQFNWDVFKSEQAEYESEGIEWQYIQFVDNQECLDLIDRKDTMGLLHLVDEESAIQKGSDEKFVQKARNAHATHKDFEAPKRDMLSFTVRHFAGAVTYLAAGFREKNKDTLHQDLSAVMRESQAGLVQLLFPREVPGASPVKKTRGGKSADKMTVGSQFMLQLASLMRTINSTGVHYVRCIKPNTLNQPAIFDMVHSAHQLRCAGVLEAVRISRMAYPNRMVHKAFIQRYLPLVTKDWIALHEQKLSRASGATLGDEATRDLCARMLVVVVEDATRYQLGKTKVFFRAFLLEALEQRRSEALGLHAVLIQKNLRALLQHRQYCKQRASAVRLETALRCHLARSQFRQQRRAALRVQASMRGMHARRLARKSRAALRLQTARRAVLALRLTQRMRRMARATCLQTTFRARSKRLHFQAMRAAAVRMQSRQRMLAQRMQYRRELAEKKEEAKLSTQLAKLQAQLQMEIEARQNAEEERERMMNERSTSGGLAPPLPPQESSGQMAPSSARVPPPPPSGSAPEVLEAPMPLPTSDAQMGPASVSSRIAGAAAKYILGALPANAVQTSSMEDASAMLSLVTKDRERLSQKLAAESEARKRLEVEKKELERKLRLGAATSQLDNRKLRGMAEALAREKDENSEMRQMLQHQTIEMTNLQNTKQAQDRRLIELEKKINQYDDSFYSLEARNVRDRTRMEEMMKAKNRAHEERGIYRSMLEQANERWIKERHELRRDALGKMEASNACVHEQQLRIAFLETHLRTQAQVEEEVSRCQKCHSSACGTHPPNEIRPCSQLSLMVILAPIFALQVRMYKEQCQMLAEQLAAGGGAGSGTSTPVASATQNPRAGPKMPFTPPSFLRRDRAPPGT